MVEARAPPPARRRQQFVSAGAEASGYLSASRLSTSSPARTSTALPVAKAVGAAADGEDRPSARESFRARLSRRLRPSPRERPTVRQQHGGKVLVSLQAPIAEEPEKEAVAIREYAFDRKSEAQARISLPSPEARVKRVVAGREMHGVSAPATRISALPVAPAPPITELEAADAEQEPLLAYFGSRSDLTPASAPAVDWPVVSAPAANPSVACASAPAQAPADEGETAPLMDGNLLPDTVEHAPASETPEDGEVLKQHIGVGQQQLYLKQHLKHTRRMRLHRAYAQYLVGSGVSEVDASMRSSAFMNGAGAAVASAATARAAGFHVAASVQFALLVFQSVAAAMWPTKDDGPREMPDSRPAWWVYRSRAWLDRSRTRLGLKVAEREKEREVIIANRPEGTNAADGDSAEVAGGEAELDATELQGQQVLEEWKQTEIGSGMLKRMQTLVDFEHRIEEAVLQKEHELEESVLQFESYVAHLPCVAVLAYYMSVLV